jgi:hypothetical protein
MSVQLRHSVHLWPSAEQLHLLQAALLADDKAILAFCDWRAGIDLDAELGYPVLRLLPLVYHNLLRLGAKDPLMGRLKGVYRRFWCENQQLFFDVLPLVQHLQQGGVDLLLLKGAPLALTYYGNYALRPMSDIDLAVRIGQLPKALALLREIGWDTGPDPSEDDLRYQHAIGCVRNLNQRLDVHFHISRDGLNAAADTWFWEDVETLDFQGVTVWQLAPTALLAHTILHGMRWNEETPIRWIPDALMILRQRGGDVDWQRLFAFADAQRLSQRLALGLGYLSEHFALELPEAVVGRLHNPLRRSWRERIENGVILSERGRWYEHPLTKQWVIFAEYCGLADTDSLLPFLNGYSHYLRYRWRLRGRLEILPTVLAGLWRRLV